MADNIKGYVHTEGDTGDILFLLPDLRRELRIDDTFHYTDSSNVTVHYKVEEIDFRLVESVSPDPEVSSTHWKTPEVYIGVSIVP